MIFLWTIRSTDTLPCQRTSNLCRNGASCINDGRGGYKCRCTPGYSGLDCSLEVNECLPNPCHNQGTCTVSSICLLGLDLLSVVLPPNQDMVNDYSCECPHGYTGGRCETNIDDCASNPCGNAGICTVSTW